MNHLALTAAFGAMLMCGCVAENFKAQVATQAAAHDGVVRLTRQDLAAISSSEWSGTPAPVRDLLKNQITTTWKNWKNWKQADFGLNDGQDPDQLDFSLPDFPGE